MKRKVYLLLLIMLFPFFTRTFGQTSLVKNHMIFSEGTIIQDQIHTSIGSDNPDDLDNSNYFTYVINLDPSTTSPGTMNILVGEGRYFKVGPLYDDGDKYIRDDITITTTDGSGLIDTILQDSDGSAGGDLNAYTQLQIASNRLGPSIWLQNKDLKLKVGAYANLNLSLEPTNPRPLAINGEGGDINIGNGTMIVQAIDTDTVAVGINRVPDMPNGGLHVSQNMYVTGRVTGRVGEVISAVASEDVILNSPARGVTINVCVYPSDSEARDYSLQGLLLGNAMMNVEFPEGDTPVAPSTMTSSFEHGLNMKVIYRICVEEFTDSGRTIPTTNGPNGNGTYYSEYSGVEFSNRAKFHTVANMMHVTFDKQYYYSVSLVVENATYDLGSDWRNQIILYGYLVQGYLLPISD